MHNGVEVTGLLTDVSATNVECQPDTNDTDALAEAVCAFANDMPGSGKPGFLIVGADDAGRVVGLDVTDQLLQHLSALRSQGNILPLPALEVFKVTLDGGDVAVVEVQPELLPPVRYKGRVYIKVGPGRAIA